MNTPEIFSFVGGGGKTSCIHFFARKYGKTKKVMITTTTHIQTQPFFTLENPTIFEIEQAFQTENILCIVQSLPQCCKKTMPKNLQDIVQYFIAKQQDMYFLIEADGSRQLPVKAPADYEPVILPETTHVFAIAGLDAIQQPIFQVAHRPDIYAKLLQKSKQELITPQDMIFVLTHPKGQKKSVVSNFTIILNKADSERQIQYAREAIQYTSEEVWIACFQNSTILAKHNIKEYI